jgi:hypothetical protein
MIWWSLALLFGELPAAVRGSGLETAKARSTACMSLSAKLGRALLLAWSERKAIHSCALQGEPLAMEFRVLACWTC